MGPGVTPRSRIYSQNRLAGFRYRRRLELTRALLGPFLSRDMRLLDLGCGDGTWLKYIAPDIGSGVGIDIGWSGASEEWSSPPPNIVFKKDDFFSSGFEHESFDAVCCFETLEHVQEPADVIRCMRNYLKIGGVAAVSVPIEIGLSVLAKEVSARATRYQRTLHPEDQWTVSELWRAAMYRVDALKTQRTASGRPGHRGFDYRGIEAMFKESFHAVRCSWTPFPWLGPFLNIGVIYRGFK